MCAERDRVDVLVEAILERRGVDWDEEIRGASGRGMRSVLEQLRAVDRISRVDSRPTLRRFGEFEIFREIGQGAMATVYEARHRSSGRRVALKVVPASLGLSASGRRRLEREARALASLHHRCIVGFHASGRESVGDFIAMDLVNGPSLRQVLDRTHDEVDPDRAEWYRLVRTWIADVAEGLDHAHRRGILHRDVKPANLLLSPRGEIRIADFGIAVLTPERGPTRRGGFIGTPAYIAPELLTDPEASDHRSDIYSLGAVLYELLTRRRAFPDRSRETLMRGILTRDPRPPRVVDRSVPRDLDAVCMKALRREPSRRYPTAGEMGRDLLRSRTREPARATTGVVNPRVT